MLIISLYKFMQTLSSLYFLIAQKTVDIKVKTNLWFSYHHYNASFQPILRVVKHCLTIFKD